uniref:Dopey_N domain-containing protein n=1 Tax=Mesocestoides corti TaxID=53468 RepID=A0A5K3F4F7_MESCO
MHYPIFLFSFCCFADLPERKPNIHRSPVSTANCLLLHSGHEEGDDIRTAGALFPEPWGVPGHERLLRRRTRRRQRRNAEAGAGGVDIQRIPRAHDVLQVVIGARPSAIRLAPAFLILVLLGCDTDDFSSLV